MNDKQQNHTTIPCKSITIVEGEKSKLFLIKNVMKKFMVTEENDKYDKYIYKATGNNKIILEQSLSK